MTSVCLLGVGTARPSLSIAQEEAAALATACCGGDRRRARLLRELFRRTTVRGRGSALLRPGADRSADPQGIHWFYPLPTGERGNGEVNDSGSPPATVDGAAPAATALRIGRDRVGPLDGEQRGPTTGERMAQFRRLASPLAADAARAALADAGAAPADITHLVTVTCTGFASPGVDFDLIQRLGLPRSVQRTQVGFMGCAAAINGLRVAGAFAAADESARVLVCCVELCSLHFQYGVDPEQMTANALFADGAAAAIVGQGSRGRLRLIDTDSQLIEGTEDQMGWRIGDHGFEMTLSPRVPGTIARHVRPWLERWLGRHGLGIADVGSWAIHPGGPRVLSAVAGRLGLGAAAVEPSAEVLRTCGNMSSPTVLFILRRLLGAGAPPPHVILSFGPGLTAEAALLGE